jgi:hypothetical protein
MTISRFYRTCFYNEAVEAMGRAGLLSKVLHLRYKKLGAFFKIFNESSELRKAHPFLCRALKMCALPSYLGSAASTKQKVKRCSKLRYCPFCWNRMMCKSYTRMTYKKDKIPGYKYFYSEKVLLLPKDTPYTDICSAGLSMFTPKWKYRKSEGLKSGLIAGVAEHLVVHSFKDKEGVRSFKLILRKIAYCHPDSYFAKTSICSSSRLGKAAVSFCSFPISMLYDGPLRTIKLDEAFRRRRLFRQYGSFYGPS